DGAAPPPAAQEARRRLRPDRREGDGNEIVRLGLACWCRCRVHSERRDPGPAGAGLRGEELRVRLRFDVDLRADDAESRAMEARRTRLLPGGPVPEAYPAKEAALSSLLSAARRASRFACALRRRQSPCRWWISG